MAFEVPHNFEQMFTIRNVLLFNDSGEFTRDDMGCQKAILYHEKRFDRFLTALLGMECRIRIFSFF